MFFELLTALVFGFVEGITEFLPISSTAHLMIAARLMGIPQSEAIKSFEIVIQSGAILAVLIFTLKRFAKQWSELRRISYFTVIGFLPTALVGLALYSFVKKFLLGNFTLALIALFVGGAALVLFERWLAKKPAPAVSTAQGISYQKAIAIGLCQTLAFIPGVSRSAATAVGGMLLGLSRPLIVEFSFFLAIPTMMAATGLDIIKNHATLATLSLPFVAMGFATSFFVAYLALGWFLRYVKTNTFAAFGWYRMALALLLFVVWRF